MSGVSPRVARLFHRSRAANLRVEAHADVIIPTVPTVLHWGDWSDVRWLFRTYGWAHVRRWLERDVGTYRSLPESVQVFWTSVLLGAAV